MAQHEWKTTLATTSFHLAGQRASAHTTYIALLGDFAASRDVGIFGSDRVDQAWGDTAAQPSNVATCIRALMLFATTSHTILDRSIFSLLALYYALLHGDVGLATLARSSYTVTLNHYSHHLATTTTHNRHSTSHTLMCTSVALQILELLNDTDLEGEGQLTHLDGVMSMLNMAGPEALRSDPNACAVFGGFRGMATFVDIDRRVPSVLAKAEWRDKPYATTKKTTRDRLADLGLQIPIHMQSSGDVLRSADSDEPSHRSIVDRCLLLLNDISTLQRSLEQWHCDLKTSVPVELSHSRNYPQANSLDIQDLECQPTYSSSSQRMVFLSGPVAGMLSHYWAFQLELLIVRLDLQEVMLDQGTDDRDSVTLRDTIVRSWKDDKVKAAEMADMIVQTGPRLSSCIEGILGLQGPMKTLGRYYKGSLKQLWKLRGYRRHHSLLQSPSMPPHLPTLESSDTMLSRVEIPMFIG
ncbi:hypothetical protein LTR78_001267 [Recurvomyces mirabilis]|uniref:Uncharacterized protein n=1 Tax=Recurvomyces mirabilis TaxID=574656 RepID=A0AAE0WVW3_9PEZI|nr:hypothetical protein LTR78_001267 [Recurvomyces mirabilis]KAK5161243.1 hypothetical protein LTS14_001039 [Recurvomyces mirabilis]